MTIRFPDVSNFQQGLSLRGAVAAFAKATEGTTITDQSYVTFRTQARQLGIPFAGYHFVNATDINQQAAHAHSVLGSTPAIWDAEVEGATVPRLVALTSAFRRLGGNPRLVYLPHWWWQDIGSPDLRPLAAAGLALVSSNYTTYSDTGPGWASYGGMAPTIWQYTDQQPFNGQQVDFNAYRGTVDQLRALLGGGDDVTPEEHDAVLTASAFAYGCANGADTYWLYDHTKAGGRTVQSLTPYYARIAAAVAANALAAADDLTPSVEVDGTSEPPVGSQLSEP